MQKTFWTIEEEAKLKELYPNAYCAIELVPIIGKSLKSIYYKANKLGLKRNSNIGNKNLLITGVAHRFKKGLIPHNKGKKGLISANATSFKKGNVPANYKHKGAYIANSKKGKYWVIQVPGTGKRIIYVRYLWEQANGPIPKGMVVAFKNGFIEDRVPVIDDLKLISRIENLKINTGYDVINEKFAIRQLHKSKIKEPSPELIKLKQQQLKVNRLIKSIENENNTSSN